MLPNSKLKAAIYSCGMTQRVVAELVEISELSLSKIVTGRKTPSSVEQAKLAQLLGRKQEDLFPPPSEWNGGEQ